MRESLLPRVVILSDRIDIICKVCEFVCSDQKDIDSLSEHGACSSCCLNFMYTNASDWKKGIRPSKQEARKKMGHEHNYSRGEDT